MENNEYGFKLEDIVNNSVKGQLVSNTIKTARHNMNNSSFEKNLAKFCGEHNSMLINLAEENIATVADLNLYINWIKQYGKQWN